MLDAITITALGNTTRTRFEGLEEMQQAVGGWIEAVDFELTGEWGKDSILCTLWLNEEGKLLDLPRNQKATDLVSDRIMPEDYIAGDVLITGGVGPEGETLSIQPEAAKFLMNWNIDRVM